MWVANVPVRRTGVRTLPSRAKQPAGGRRRALALARLTAQAPVARTARRLPADDDPVALGEALDAVADSLDRPGTLVPEEHRVPMAPAVLLDHVQVAVADTGRLDAHEHLARLGRRDGDLLERDGVALAEDDA